MAHLARLVSSSQDYVHEERKQAFSNSGQTPSSLLRAGTSSTQNRFLLPTKSFFRTRRGFPAFDRHTSLLFLFPPSILHHIPAMLHISLYDRVSWAQVMAAGSLTLLVSRSLSKRMGRLHIADLPAVFPHFSNFVDLSWNNQLSRAIY